MVANLGRRVESIARISPLGVPGDTMKCEFAPSYSPLLRFCIRTFALVAVVLAAQMTAFAAIKPIGEFSNIRYTAEHAYGYSVEVWQDGNQFFGLFMAPYGLAGDT